MVTWFDKTDTTTRSTSVYWCHEKPISVLLWDNISLRSELFIHGSRFGPERAIRSVWAPEFRCRRGSRDMENRTGCHRCIFSGDYDCFSKCDMAGSRYLPWIHQGSKFIPSDNVFRDMCNRNPACFSNSVLPHHSRVQPTVFDHAWRRYLCLFTEQWGAEGGHNRRESMWLLNIIAQIEVEGTVESGIFGACWGPDDSLLALMTGESAQTSVL